MRGLLFLGLCGCSSIFGLRAPRPLTDGSASGDGAPSDDASADGSIADAPQCFGSGEYTVCLDARPGGDVSMMGAFSTGATNVTCVTSAHWTSASQPDACFVVGRHVTAGPLVATGARPLVLVATDTITFTGLVDLGSHRGNASTGAGFTIASCPTPGAASVDNNGGGGAAGGSFGALGGTGGNGQNGALGGTPVAAMVGVLHGGCFGGAGARGGGGAPALPGGGGGALYAVAGTSISLSAATIAANGAGASAAQNRWGGSGGGAGGMIVLYAPSIAATSGILVANGGGGSSGTDSAQGNPGADPDPSTPLTPAPGGTRLGAGAGGDGFPAAAIAMAGGDAPTTMTSSGGGGGGGAGYIRANVAITGVTASPAVDVVP